MVRHAARQRDADLACVIMTGQGTIASAVRAMKVGALMEISSMPSEPCTTSSGEPIRATLLTASKRCVTSGPTGSPAISPAFCISSKS